MSKDKVEDMLTQMAEEPINEELDRFTNERIDGGNNDGDDDDDVKDLHKVKPLTSVKLTSPNTIDTMCKELQESNLILEWSLKFRGTLKDIRLPYIKVLKDIQQQS
eukprot:g21038.t1